MKLSRIIVLVFGMLLVMLGAVAASGPSGASGLSGVPASGDAARGVGPELVLPTRPGSTVIQHLTDDCSFWAVVACPSPGSTYNRVSSISAVSSNDIWAAGVWFGNAGQVAHWDGNSWSVVQIPIAGVTVAAVSALAANDVWGTASYADEPSGVVHAAMVHWNGSSWSSFPISDVGNNYNYLLSVTALASDNVWAVGYYQDFYPAPARTLTVHWDGSTWTVVASPNIGLQNNRLESVIGAAVNDVWSAGWSVADGGSELALVLHWDGTNWTTVSIPDIGSTRVELHSLAAVAPSDVWAVGAAYINQHWWTLALHWDGSSWTVSPSTNPAFWSNQLWSVAASGANDVWAVGIGFETPAYLFRTVTMHWDGSSWTTYSSPNVGSGSNGLFAVAALASNDAWAAGSTSDDTATLMMHMTGVCVTPTPTPSPGTPTPGTPTPPPGTPGTATSTPTAVPCSVDFSDVHPTDYFYTAVQYLTCHNVISGYADGTFRPYNNTTRGQLSKIVALAEGWPIDTSGGPHFSDVQPNNAFYSYIETAYHHGVISGYADGTFRWGNNVTRAQLSKIIVVAEGWNIDTSGGPHFSDVSQADPFYGYIETAFNKEIISGYADGTFKPGNNATRGQIAKIVYSAINLP